MSHDREPEHPAIVIVFWILVISAISLAVYYWPITKMLLGGLVGADGDLGGGF